MQPIDEPLGAVRATINYFDRHLARGRFDIVDPGRNLMAFEPHEVVIRDMRAAAAESSADVPSLETHGFVLTTHVSRVARTSEIAATNVVAQSGTPPINEAYYDEMLPLIHRLSGAREVIPQATGLTVRFSDRSRRRTWAGAAGFVHLDVTRRSNERFLRCSLDAAGRQLAPWKRVVLYQTWRTITDPPQDNLLAVCDRRSVPMADVAFYDAVIGDAGTALESVEARSCRYGTGHRWWYASGMDARDVLVFVGYDSADPEAVQPFHTGFDVRGCENAVPRGSLEARFFAFYD
ncbi:MAG: CmcJ/NvfI family oxidoreductase [Steroidobacteraceae bacterium]